MKLELQKQLFDKYPQLFTQKNLPPSQSNMCFGFECGDGWFTLLDNLCSLIQSNKETETQATQIKEKFGGLRFYYTGGNDFIDGAVMLAEKMSEHICEECGDRGSIKYDAGWLRCRCDKHKEE